MSRLNSILIVVLLPLLVIGGDSINLIQPSSAVNESVNVHSKLIDDAEDKTTQKECAELSTGFEQKLYEAGSDPIMRAIIGCLQNK